MAEPLKENEPLESELITVAIELLDRMHHSQSRLARSAFEKYLRPYLRLALLRARRTEAERCESYRIIGSPRIIELKVAEDFVSLEITRLEAEEKNKS